jgi:hypothetical protein
MSDRARRPAASSSCADAGDRCAAADRPHSGHFALVEVEEGARCSRGCPMRAASIRSARSMAAMPRPCSIPPAASPRIRGWRRADLHHARTQGRLSPRDDADDRQGPRDRHGPVDRSPRRLCRSEDTDAERAPDRLGHLNPAGDNPMNAPAMIVADGCPRRAHSASARNPLVMGIVALLVALAGIAWLLSPRTQRVHRQCLCEGRQQHGRAQGGRAGHRRAGAGQSARARRTAAGADRHCATSMRASPPPRPPGRCERRRRGCARRAAGACRGRPPARRGGVRAVQTNIALGRCRICPRGRRSCALRGAVAQGFATRRDVERMRATAVGAASALDRSRADREYGVTPGGDAGDRPVLEAQLPRRLQAAEARARATLASRARIATIR